MIDPMTGLWMIIGLLAGALVLRLVIGPFSPIAAPDPDDHYTQQQRLRITVAERQELWSMVFDYLTQKVAMPPDAANILAVEIAEAIETAGWRKVLRDKN